MHGSARARVDLWCAVHRIYARGPRAGVKEPAGFRSERLCVGGSAGSVAWSRAWKCGSLVAVAWSLRRRCTREGHHGYGFGTPSWVRAVDRILQAKDLPAFLLATMATASEGVVFPIGGAI